MKWKTYTLVSLFIFLLILLLFHPVSACKDIIACGNTTQGSYNLLLKVRDPSRPGYQVLTIVPENYSYTYHHPWTGTPMPFTVTQSFIGVATKGDTIPNIVKAGMTYTRAGLAFGDADAITNWKNPSPYAWDDFDWIRFACQTAETEEQAVTLLTEHAVDQLHATAVPENLFVVGPQKGYVIEADMIHHHSTEIIDDYVVMSNYGKNLWNKSPFLRLISPSFSSTYIGTVQKGQRVRLGSACLYGITIVDVTSDSIEVRQTPIQFYKGNIIGREYDLFSTTTIPLNQGRTVGFYRIDLKDIQEDCAVISMSYEYFAWENTMNDIIEYSLGNITPNTMMQWSRLHTEDLKGLRGMCDNETLYPYEGCMIYKIPETSYDIISEGWFAANHPCSSIYVPTHISNTDIYEPYQTGEAAELCHSLLQTYGHGTLSEPCQQVEAVFTHELELLEPIIESYIQEQRDVSTLLTLSDMGMQEQAFLTQQLWFNITHFQGSETITHTVLGLWNIDSIMTLANIEQFITTTEQSTAFSELYRDIISVAESIINRRIALLSHITGNSSQVQDQFIQATTLIHQGKWTDGFQLYQEIMNTTIHQLQRYRLPAQSGTSTTITPITQEETIINEGASADLELNLLEVWWAPISNGTLYVRYLVNNIGQTYHNPYEPIKLNITLQNLSSDTPFAYINQPSYIDPYTWYTNETIGGCIQIHMSSKPQEIKASVNIFHHIPEENMDNNIGTATVYQGILITGKITKESNGDHIPLSSIDIKRCNEKTLRSILAVTFKTDTSGQYAVSLYPQQPLDKTHAYTLSYTDKETTTTIIKTIPDLFYNATIVQNVTFQGNPPQPPLKPIGIPIGFRMIPKIMFSIITSTEEELWYKYKIGADLYGPWNGPYQTPHITMFTHTWNNPGIYPVQLIAKNEHNMISNWSEKTFMFII